MKKFMTVALATAMTAALACTAFAADDKTETIEFSVDVNADDSYGAGKFLIDATGYETVTIVFDFETNETYGGGGMGYNTVETGAWANCNEYSNESDTMTYTIDVADIAPGDDGSQTFEIQCWWVGDDPYTATLTYTAAASETADVAPIAYLAAIVAVAGVAMVASKKRA